MHTIPFRPVWKRRWNTGAALFLGYLMAKEDSNESWWPAPMEEFVSEFRSTLAVAGMARETLRADQVIEVRKNGRRYEYKINHDVLNSIETESEK